jgi:hypothetical protein
VHKPNAMLHWFMHIGYIRASTDRQAMSIEIQQKQLKAAGCELIYTDEGESGGKRKRPQLNKALEHIPKGDVGWKPTLPLTIWDRPRAY